MRNLFVCLALFIPFPAFAQDPAMQAAQQASQMSMQQQQILNQQIQNQQILNQGASDNMEGYPLAASRPSVHVEPGRTPGTLIVRLKDRTRGASIFYTVDGWTPTPSSARYDGPITIDHSATLRAVAVIPAGGRSLVKVADLDPAGPTQTALPPERVLSLDPGTPVRVAFTAPVTSRGLQVGDELPVVLGEDIWVDGNNVAPRGTPVLATVTEVDPRGRGGLPGAIAFQVRSVKLTDGRLIHLRGVELQEAEPRYKAALFSLVVPLGPLFVPGRDAIIPQGATLTARIAAPTVP